jgi:hypothetical protein
MPKHPLQPPAARFFALPVRSVMASPRSQLPQDAAVLGRLLAVDGREDDDAYKARDGH